MTLGLLASSKEEILILPLGLKGGRAGDIKEEREWLVSDFRIELFHPLMSSTLVALTYQRREDKSSSSKATVKLHGLKEVSVTSGKRVRSMKVQPQSLLCITSNNV